MRDVGLKALCQGLREPEGLAAQDLDLVGEPAAAAQDLVGELCQDGCEAGRVRAELREEGLCLCGELGEGDVVGRGALGRGCARFEGG